jgi:cold-inducible RNA-binding protein
MSNKIFVGNLSYSATDADLRAAFEEFGNIQDVKIVKDRESGRSRGFGFITYSSSDEAKKALAMNGQDMDGRKLRVNEALDKEQSRDRGEY